MPIEECILDHWITRSNIYSLGAIQKWRQPGGRWKGVEKSWRPDIGGRGLKPKVWDHGLISVGGA